MPDRMWSRVGGNALVYVGRCLVHELVLEPNASSDYADVYDGRDATSGKYFCRLEAKTVSTWQLRFGPGVPFDGGIFVANESEETFTTVVYTPLD